MADDPREERQWPFPGYTRDPKVTEQLVEALRAALYAHPDQRLGQLLLNLSNERLDMTDNQNRFWDRHDEEWVAVLFGSDAR